MEQLWAGISDRLNSLEIVALVAFSLSVVFAVPLAARMSAALSHRQPESKPFFWGYYFGSYGLLNAGAFTVSLWIVLIQDYPRLNIGTAVLTGYFSTLSLAYIGVIQRRKSGWITATFLGMFPVIWIINWLYIRSRWSELSRPVSKATKTKAETTSLASGQYVGGTVFWAIQVHIFVYFLQPFGKSPDARDWVQVWVFILLPPIVTFLAIRLKRLQSNDSRHHL